jgi:hypothetical protein
MINLFDIVLSIVNSLLSIISIILPLIMMKNYNLIIVCVNYEKEMIIENEIRLVIKT